MGYYKNIRETSQKELDAFPPLDVEKCTEETNQLFKPYVFMQKHKWEMEIWTSCCMVHRMEDRYPRTCILTTHRPTVLATCIRVYEIRNKECVVLTGKEVEALTGDIQ